MRIGALAVAAQIGFSKRSLGVVRLRQRPDETAIAYTKPRVAFYRYNCRKWSLGGHFGRFETNRSMPGTIRLV